ncbi:MAG TPA: amidohydrolase family protein [Acidobacteriota bacterium]|nr:amidohydrolase family protein [Acidobacteriota bacterium]
MNQATSVFLKPLTLLAVIPALLLWGGLSLRAQEDDPRQVRTYPLPPETPSQVLIRNATVWTQSQSGILENTDVLLVDGKIRSVGSGLSAPSHALVIEGQGLHVTPGLIDCHSHSAVEGFGVNEGGSSVTAEVQIDHVLDPGDRYIYLQLSGGLTAANVLHGSANAIGGQNSVIKLRWGASNPQDLLFEDAPEGVKFALGENPKQSNLPNFPGLPQRYPRSRMGVEATIRNAFREARQYQAEWEAYDHLSQSEKERAVPPRKNLRLDAVVEILEGTRLIHSHSYRADEILMLIRLAEEFGVTIQTFQHVLEGYRVADEMAAHGAGGSTFADWWAYKLEAFEAIPYNAALMTQRGVNVSINSDNGSLARRLNLDAAKTIRYGGMTPQQALAMVTNNPASQLGIDHRVGSLEAGKDADIVVWTGSPLSVYSQVSHTFVDGQLMFSRQHDLENRERVEQARQALIAEIKEPPKEEAEEESMDEEVAETDEEVEPQGDGESQEAMEDDPQENDSDGEESEELPDNPDHAASYGYAALAPSQPTAILGATVHTISGEDIEDGVVVFADGRISAVGGPGTDIPSGARRVEAAGKHLWPGIIHAQTVLGLNEIASVAGSVDSAEMGDWNPDIDVHLAVHAASTHIPVSRSGGISHAVVMPQGGILAGTTALIRLDGWTWEEMSAVPRHSMSVEWEGGGGGFAAFFGGRQSLEERQKQSEERAEKLEEYFKDAEAYLKAKGEVSAAEGSWEYDPRLEALESVLNGDMPLYVSADSYFAIEDAMDWALKRGLRLVIVGGRDAPLVAEKLARHKVPVVLTSVASDPTRDDEPYDVRYATPAALEKAGVLFAIAGIGTPGGSSNARNVTLHAGIAAGFGLDRQAAYRSLTLNPARILGVEATLGSIEEGKSASLVLTDGDLLEQSTAIEQVWIDGMEPSMEDKHKRLYEKYSNRPR